MLNLFRKDRKESKQPFQLSNLIEILQDGVCITHASGELIYINKAAYNLLGINPNSDIGKINFFEKCMQDKKMIQILREQIKEQGFIQNYELTLRNLNGDQLDVILNANVIGDFSQQSIGYLFLIKDVTELKKIQHQLLQSQKLESIGLMASGIAHDFNNILAAIIPNAELIKYSLKEVNENYKRAEIIEKSAHRASDIAQRLLTFTRHKDQNFIEAIDLNQEIDDSVDLLVHSLPKNVKLARRMDPDLQMVEGDGAQMQQIIMNLVINAADAMPKGGTILLKTEQFTLDKYYQVGALEPGEYIRLIVQDNGSGIPLEVLSKIFDPFFTTKEVGKGTGLGLSVVYGIVKSMKGHIEVNSKIGEGTTFYLYFPELESEIPEVVEDSRKKAIPKDLKILVIDDEDYVLDILADILDFLGYQSVKQNGGEAAVQYFREHNDEIQYVIVDMKMPRMDGRATSTELRKLDPKVKLIFTSGFDDSPMNEKDFEGVVGFLKKPYSINHVSNVLEKIVAQ